VVIIVALAILLGVVLANIALKNKLLLPSTLLALLYTGSIATALLLSVVSEKYFDDFYSDNVASAIFFGSAFLISYYPILQFREDGISKIIIPSPFLFNCISWVSLGLSVYAFVYFLPIAISIFGLESNSMVRYEIVAGNHPFIENTIFNTVAGSWATFFLVPMVIGFVNLLNGRRVLGLSLIFASSCYVVFVLAYFGRDGVLFWLLAVVMTFLSLAHLFDDNVKRYVLRVVTAVGVCSIAAFFYITHQRFSEEGSLLLAVLDYYGQPFINFSRIYGGIDPVWGGFTFGPIYTLVHGSPLDPSGLEAQIESLGSYTWVFGSFVNNLYIDFGSFGTLLLIFSVVLIAMCFLSGGRHIRLGSFLFYIFFTQMLVQSVFYFRNYNNIGNFYLVAMPIFCGVLNLLASRARLIRLGAVEK